MLRRPLAALVLLPLLAILLLPTGCEGPAGACEDTKASTCTDVKKANCTWSDPKITETHKFHEGKACSDVGYICSGGTCKKR